MVTNEELVKIVKKNGMGSPESGQLFYRLFEIGKKYMLKHGIREEDTHDILHDYFISDFYKCVSKYDESYNRSFVSYSFEMLIKRMSNFRLKNGKEIPFENIYNSNYYFQDITDIELQEARDRLFGLISYIENHEHRLAIYLRLYLPEISVTDIAEIAGVNINTMASWFHRASKTVRVVAKRTGYKVEEFNVLSGRMFDLEFMRAFRVHYDSLEMFLIKRKKLMLIKQIYGYSVVLRLRESFKEMVVELQKKQRILI